jgi:hypothetical protein
MFNERAECDLAHSYDPQTDVLTIEGVRYQAALFRFLSFAPPAGLNTGMLLRVTLDDGVVTCRREDGPCMLPCVHGPSVVHAGG